MNSNGYLKVLSHDDMTEKVLYEMAQIETTSGKHPYTLEELNEITSDPLVSHHAYYYEGEMVAFLTSKYNKRYYDGSIYIINLVCLPEYRRHHFAQSLIYQLAVDSIQSHHGVLITLDCSKIE